MDALVFDFDGLVLDTETAEFHSVHAVFTEHGLDLDRDWWVTIIGSAEHPHWSEVFESALGRPVDDREALIERRRVHHHSIIAEETVRPGVVELLDEAAAEGVVCAVASSSPLDWVVGHLDRLGLLDRFAEILTRDHVPKGRTKPAPDLFLLACEAVGAAPARSVALEDSPNGVAAAKAAGMRVVGVPAGMTAGLDLSAADLVVPSLAEVDLTRLQALL